MKKNRIVLYSILILFSCLFLGVGYASISSIGLDVEGEASLDKQSGILISDVVDGINTNSSLINTYYQTNLDSTITLERNNLSSIVTYQITILNKTETPQEFEGIIYDDEWYDNNDIIIELSGLSVGDVVNVDNSITFTVTFKYDPNISSITNNILNSYINFKFKEYEAEPDPLPPVLNRGMVPVVIDNDGTVTTVNEEDPNWYNYSGNKWANAVLVKSNGTNTRSYYLSNDGVEVSQSDILAYFVWIPRYHYQIWTLESSSTGNEQEIIIRWSLHEEVKSGTQIGEYRTQPGFSFGNKELDGFWVGKFETSTESSSTCYTSASANNCNNINQDPRILANVYSLRFQTFANQFQTAIKFAGGSMSNNVVSFSGNTTFGLETDSDSHMSKNTEWGAVAYLSRSKYGVNGEVIWNNNSTFLTGCGGTLDSYKTSTTACSIPYGGNTSYPQSTTGNISGVFDMAGGSYESSMANHGNTTKSSGFAAEWFSNSNNAKYYDLYDSSIFTGSSTTNASFCTVETCGGHSLFETKGWYGTSSGFAYSNNNWFLRGGGTASSLSSSTGIFASNAISGSYLSYNSFRTILVNVE